MRFAFLLSLILIAVPALAQGNFDDVTIRTQALRGPVSVLFGAGGNIGVSVGEDGVFLIDDQFAPLTEKIQAAVAEMTDRPIRFVVNTHWHGDHTGGNENLGEAGAVIVAHDNVYRRMSTVQELKAFNRTVPASPNAALPVITFNDQAAFHLNGEEVRAHHVPYAHTDGDSLLHFTGSNVIHMGDTFFKGRYPFIDLGSGGNINGIIKAAEVALDLADEDTMIIPGHGEMADKADLQAYHDVMVAARDRVQAMIEDGASLEAIQAAKPLADFDQTYGGGFINPDRFLGFVYTSLTQVA